MSRKLVYLNGQNESITFETGPYLIVKIEGLGIPNVDRQEQKAPYQDGTTYIGSLLQNRDIVVELAITKPNDFANIALYRRELSQRLTPKYGLGTLTYTDEGGNSYNLRAVVSSMVFPNKDFRDPYMRAMVTFTACDPYWKGETDTTIILPTDSVSSESIISAIATSAISIIERSDGSLFIAYVRSSDGYIVSRTYTTSWSAESVINPASSNWPSIIERFDGSLFIAYMRSSDGYLVSRTYTTSWSAESVINPESSGTLSIIERFDGSLFIAYRRSSDGYIVSRTYTTSWSAESVINPGPSNWPSITERFDGSLFVAYRRSSDNYLVSRTYTTSWSAESVIDTTNGYQSSVIERSDGSLFIVYVRASDRYLVARNYTTYTASWSDQSVIAATPSDYISVIELDNRSVFIAYIRTSDMYIASVIIAVTPVPAVNTGDVPAPFLVTFQGPSVNPRIINQNTLEYIRLNTTLAAADSFEVDTSFGNKTVILTQGGIVKNGIAFLDIGSTFFQIPRPTLPDLPPGVNPFRGLKAYWNMDDVPEIPTATGADLTYLQDAWANTDAWGGNSGALTFSDGILHCPANGINRSTVFPSGTTIKIKIKSIVNPQNISIIYDASASLIMDMATTTEYQIFSGVIPAGISGNIVIGTGSNIFDIDWIYIGTGAYLPNSLVDNSGNGNHGTIQGATPVAGISGKALAFDGVNDYVVASSSFALPDIGTYHAIVNSTSITNSYSEPVFQYGTVGTSGWLGIERYASTKHLRVFGNNGTGTVFVEFLTFFTDGVACTVDVIVDWNTKGISAYKDGLLFGTGTLTSAIKPPIDVLYIGARKSLDLDRWYGTIDELRIYNRAQSAKEVKYLYYNPGVPIPTDATVIYYEDDAVLSTATASLKFTERYSGL